MTIKAHYFFACLGVMLVTAGISAAAQVTVDGKVRWVDRNGPGQPSSTHPAREVAVEICDSNLPASSQVLFTTYTDDDGHYTAVIPLAPGATRDLIIRARSQSKAASVHPIQTPLTYIIASPVRAHQMSGATLRVDITGDYLTTPDWAFSVLDALLGGQQYVLLRSKRTLPQIQVEFPTDKSTSFFQKDTLYILQPDRWDWDVILHEYGHYVSKTFILDQNPGGDHSFYENLGERLPKERAIRLAWGEGWPTYFSITAQLGMKMSSFGIPYVGDTKYTDTEDSNLEADLSSVDGDGSLGEDNEVSVFRILYDIDADTSGVDLSDDDVWKILTAATPTTLSTAISALDSSLSPQKTLLLGAKVTKNHVASGPVSPNGATSLPDLPPTFSWMPNGGGPHHLNNQFSLAFYDSTMKKIVEVPGIIQKSYTPSADVWTVIKSHSGMYWVVVGGNVDDPATGPYLSNAQPLLAPQGVSGSQ